MLSDQDIFKELIKAKNLVIYPLKVKSINKGSINLTANKYAWDIENEESVVSNDVIHIKANRTVAIVTNEHIYVSDSIKGSYHSRVSLSVRGLSNISTTLDPTWNGLSLITISNMTKTEQKIGVNQEFVTLTLEYLNTKASKDGINKAPSRTDLISKLASKKQWAELQPLAEMSVANLRIAMKDSDEYQLLGKQNRHVKAKIWFKRNSLNLILIPLFVALFGTIVGGLILAKILSN